MSCALPGSTASVSASGTSSNGVVWALDNSTYCTPAVRGLWTGGAARLERGGPSQPSYGNSSQVGADTAGNAVKFTVPMIANGEVYVGTRGNNPGGVYVSTRVSGELEVYGLKPD